MHSWPRTLMRCNSDLDELWIGICCLSFQGFVRLIVSVFTHIYIYGDTRMNDAEEYVKLLRWRGSEGERRMLLRVAQSRRVIKVALCM